MDFHWEYYRELNPDLYWQGYETRAQCTQHYLNHGIQEKRKYLFCDLFPDFNWSEYKKQNPKLILSHKLAYEYHYFTVGRFLNLFKPVSAIKKKEPVKTKLEPIKTKLEPVKTKLEPVKSIEEPVKGIEEPVKGIEEAVKGIEDPVKGIEEPVKGIEEAVKTIEEPVKSKLEPIKTIESQKKKPKIGLFLTGWGEPNVSKKKEILLSNLNVIKTWKEKYELDLYIYLYTTSCLDELQTIPFTEYVSHITIIPKAGIVGEFIYGDVSKRYHQYEYVILFLDDIQLSQQSSLDKLIWIYQREPIDILGLPLTVDSPSNHSFMLQDQIMIRQGYTYRETNFIEYFFYMISSKKFKKYLNFFTNRTKWCWGIDLILYPNGIRMGMVEIYPVKHYFKAMSYHKSLPDPLVELNYVCGTKHKIKHKVNLRKEKY